MAERLALKRLAGSDLSFFEWHFRNKTYGDHRQKGINLNTDVFVDQFYPQAHALLGAKWPVLVTLYGPGAAPAFAPPGDHKRPITYNNRKNWRLNGGTIPDDAAIPNRFQQLAPGDLALLRFRGEPAPIEVDVVLIANGVLADAEIHARLDPLVPSGRRTMIPITPAQIEDALRGVVLPADHPFAGLEPDPVEEAAVEEVALGGTPPAILRRLRGGRRLSPGEMAEARAEAARVGAEGEELLNGLLSTHEREGLIRNLDWISQRDAAAPYDFRFETSRGQPVKLDAKSTGGRFERTIHVSAGEMIEAAQPDCRYDIARVYSIDDDGARVRISENIGEFAKRTIDGLVLPAGVRVDGFSLDPATLQWGEEIIIPRPEESDDEK